MARQQSVRKCKILCWISKINRPSPGSCASPVLIIIISLVSPDSDLASLRRSAETFPELNLQRSCTEHVSVVEFCYSRLQLWRVKVSNKTLSEICKHVHAIPPYSKPHTLVDAFEASSAMRSRASFRASSRVGMEDRIGKFISFMNLNMSESPMLVKVLMNHSQLVIFILDTV